MAQKFGYRELNSDADAMVLGKNLVSRAKKHAEIFVVERFRGGNGIEVTSKDEDYISNPSEISSNEDTLVEVEVNSEASDDCSECEVIRFDDSADDGYHEDYFVKDDGGGENIQPNEVGNLNDFGTNNHQTISQLDHENFIRI